MSNYTVQKNIDYISLTCDVWHDNLLDAWGEIKSPNRNYTSAKVNQDGIIVMTNPSSPRMRTHVILSGQTMNNVRAENGMSDEQIIKWCKSSKAAKFKRIDIAITSHRTDGGEHELTPHRCAVMAKNGRVKTKMKTDNHVANPNLEIETCYIGSRKSRNRLFRSYDKGLELGDTANKIIRYELETRKNAHTIANMIVRGDDIGEIMNSYIEFDSAVWDEIVGTESSIIPRLNDTLTENEKLIQANNSRWHWLLTQVAPTMAKAIKLDGDLPHESQKMKWFLEMVVHEYDKLDML